MNTHRSPQLGAALALVQLLQEHPELPVAGWRVSDCLNVLIGHLHDENASFDALRAFAEVLGGSIRAGSTFESVQGQAMRSHQLVTVWRDIEVEVWVSLPLAAALERAA